MVQGVYEFPTDLLRNNFEASGTSVSKCCKGKLYEILAVGPDDSDCGS